MKTVKSAQFDLSRQIQKVKRQAVVKKSKIAAQDAQKSEENKQPGIPVEDIEINVFEEKLRKQKSFEQSSISQVVSDTLRTANVESVKDNQSDNNLKMYESILSEIKAKAKYQKKLQAAEKETKKLLEKLWKQHEKNQELQNTIETLKQTVFDLEQSNPIVTENQMIEKAQSQFKSMKVSVEQLEYQNENLKEFQVLYNRLQIEYESVKLRCQSYEQNANEYKKEISKIKKAVLEYENMFYSLKNISINSSRKNEMISETQAKMEAIERKVEEYENSFVQRQLQTYTQEKEKILQRFNRELKIEMERISQNVYATQQKKQIQKAEVIAKLEGLKEEKLMGVNRRIEAYKEEIHQKKLKKKGRTIRQRVKQIEAKLTEVSHSIIFSSKLGGDVDEINHLRSQINDKNQQIEYLKKVSTGSYISDSEKQEYSINVIGESQNRGSTAAMAFSNLSTALKSKYLNQDKMFSPIPPTYDDGTPIPTRTEYKDMLTDLNKIRKKYRAYEEQIKHIRQENQKLVKRNQEIYADFQKQRNQHKIVSNTLHTVRLEKDAMISQLKNQIETEVNHLSKEVQFSHSENKRLREIIQNHENEITSIKKTKERLRKELQSCKKQMQFTESVSLARNTEKNIEVTKKMSEKLSNHTLLEAKVEKQGFQLEEQLASIFELENQNQKLQKIIEQMKQEIQDCKQKTQMVQLRVQQKEKEIMELICQKEVSEKDNQFINASLVLEIERMKKQINSRSQRNISLQKQLEKLDKKLKFTTQNYEGRLRKADEKYHRLELNFLGIAGSDKDCSQSQIEIKESFESISCKNSLDLDIRQSNEQEIKENEILVNFKGEQIIEELSFASELASVQSPNNA